MSSPPDATHRPARPVSAPAVRDVAAVLVLGAASVVVAFPFGLLALAAGVSSGAVARLQERPAADVVRRAGATTLAALSVIVLFLVFSALATTATR